MDGLTDRSTGRVGAALIATTETFRHAGLRLLDVALPPRCVGCGTRDSWICHDYAGALPLLPSKRCRVCAVPQPGPQVCADCYRNPPRFDALHTAFLHEGLARELVHGLKYRGHRHLTEPPPPPPRPLFRPASASTQSSPCRSIRPACESAASTSHSSWPSG